MSEQDFRNQRQDVLEELDGINNWNDDLEDVEKTVDNSDDIILAQFWKDDEYISVYSSKNILNKWDAYHSGDDVICGQMSPQAVLNWVEDKMKNKI